MRIIAGRHQAEHPRLNGRKEQSSLPEHRSAQLAAVSGKRGKRYLALLGSYLGPELVAEGRCLVLSGKTGRGKTHVAVAIAYRAIQNGFTARFITAKELIDDLSDPRRKDDF